MGAQIETIKLQEHINYKGQVQSGKPSGKGKLTISKNGENIDFQGIFENGIPKSGKLLYKNFQYAGETQEAAITGKGKLKDQQDKILDGNFVDGVFMSGKITNQGQYQYSGSIDNEQFDGQGCYEDIQDKQFLKGQFKNGNLHGKGYYSFRNNDKYQGQFSQGSFHGSGIYTSVENRFKMQALFDKGIPCQQAQITFGNGDIYKGQIKNGYLHGRGQYIYSDSTTFKGMFYYNDMTGECQIEYNDKNELQLYQGEVKEGLYNGLGVLHYRNGLIFKGYFLQNMKNGPGIIILGKKMYKCLYVMDRLIGKVQQIGENM